MKILLIYNRYEFRGGEDTYVDGLTHLLKSRGHTVVPYFKDSRSIHSLWDKISSAIGLFWNFQTAKEVNRLIDKHKPDVAHIHNIYPLISPTIYYVCKKRGIRIVQTIHNYKFMCPKNSLFRNNKICELCIDKPFFYPSVIFACYHNSRFASFIYSLSFSLHRAFGAFNFIDMFIFPSSFTRDYYLKYAHVSLERTMLLPYFVSPDKSLMEKNKSLNYFLYIGRLSEEKGIDCLLHTFSTIPHQHLLVIGDGNLRSILIRKYSQYKNIVFKKYVDHSFVSSYIKNSLAVIVPSLWYEVLPMVILEAVRMQKCVYVPQHNPNLKRLKLSSSKVHTYSNLKNLIDQLKKDIYTPHNHTGVDQLIRQTSPNFHYKKLISIYRHANNK